MVIEMDAGSFLGKGGIEGWAPLDSHDIIGIVAPLTRITAALSALRFPLKLYQVLNEMKGGSFFPPSWNIFIKMGSSSPNFRGGHNKKIFETSA